MLVVLVNLKKYFTYLLNNLDLRLCDTFGVIILQSQGGNMNNSDKYIDLGYSTNFKIVGVIETNYKKWMHLSKYKPNYVIDEYDKKFKDVKGFSHSAEYKDDYVIEKTKIDYTKADLKELQKNQLIAAQENQNVDYIGYKTTLKTFKSNGFKEVKDGKFEELK